MNQPHIAVLGAGPVGLECLVAAHASGCAATLYEASAVAVNVERWGMWRMFTPFGHNRSDAGRALLLRERPTQPLPDDGDFLTGREFREAYLVPLAQSAALSPQIRLDARVLAVGHAGGRFRLLVRDGKGGERLDLADAVFDCTGLTRPQFLGDGGVPAVGELAARPHLAFGAEDVAGAKRGHYSDKSTLVIGGGYTAATVVIELASLAIDHPATWVVWLGRGPLPRLPGDPYRDRDALAVRANALAARCDGSLEYHAHVGIDELTHLGPDKGFRVVGRAAGGVKTWEVDRVIAAAGTRPDGNLAAEVAGVPGYFALGSKAGGRRFLLAHGLAEVAAAFAKLGPPAARRAAPVRAA